MAIEKGSVIEGHSLIFLFEQLSKTMQDKLIDYYEKYVFRAPLYYMLRDRKRGDDFLSLLREL